VDCRLCGLIGGIERNLPQSAIANFNRQIVNLNRQTQSSIANLNRQSAVRQIRNRLSAVRI